MPQKFFKNKIIESKKLKTHFSAADGKFKINTIFCIRKFLFYFTKQKLENFTLHYALFHINDGISVLKCQFFSSSEKNVFTFIRHLFRAQHEKKSKIICSSLKCTSCQLQSKQTSVDFAAAPVAVIETATICISAADVSFDVWHWLLHNFTNKKLEYQKDLHTIFN